MQDDHHDAIALFRRKFEAFHRLSTELGKDLAWEKMLEGYPERQKKQMGAFINDSSSLASGFSQAIPVFQKMGMSMQIVDISTTRVDAVLEIQRKCPVLEVCKEYGLTKPCHVICEMDVEATRRAFSPMRGDILCTQADGASVCVFKYERESTGNDVSASGNAENGANPLGPRLNKVSEGV
jgi:predicted ArsR family transcriptional regulator